MTTLAQLPCIFLSYWEPNAEANYEELCRHHPVPANVQRVHGVRGFDTAHKMAALVAGAPKFVMVDADTRVLNPSRFWDLRLEDFALDAQDSDRTSLCFASLNSVLATPDHRAGYSYGNGGLKVWSRARLLEMATHENAPDGSADTQVEFCHSPWYRHNDSVWGLSVVNSSREQAFRAGLREGYKLSEFVGKFAYSRMLSILGAWMQLSADVEHGFWSMLGAQCGLLLRLGDWNPTPKTAQQIVNEEGSCLELLRKLVELGCDKDSTGIGNLVRSQVTNQVRSILPAFRIRTPEQATFEKSKMRLPNA